MGTNGRIDETSNTQVLGLAGLASGVVGGLIAAVMARRAERREAEAAQNTSELASLIGSVRDGAADTLGRAMSRAPQSTQDWKDTSQRVKDRAAVVANEGQARTAQGLARIDLDDLSKRARGAVPASDVRKGAKRAGKRARAAADEGRKRSRKQVESVDLRRVAKRGRESVASASVGLGDSASSLAAIATERARDATKAVRQQSPQLRERAQGIASEALSAGEDLLAQARERAPELRDAIGETVTPRVKQVQGSTAPTLASASSVLASTLESGKELVSDARGTAERDLLPALKDRAGTAAQKARNAEKVLGGASSQASRAYSQVAGNAGERSRDAAQATAQGTKDTGAIAAWTAVGGGLVYYAFLDEEQRAKVKAAGSRVWEEARSMYRDLQGQDGSFDEA